MSTLPTVSICIPVYNRQQYIRCCIDSILAQTYGAVEICVVDDGSTDDTAELLRSYGTRIITARNKKNQGIGYTRNRALKMAHGELRGVLDSDDYYEPDFVRRCVEELQAHPKVGLVYCDNYRADRDSIRWRIDAPADGLTFLEAVLMCQVAGDAWLARWSVLKWTKLHDVRMGLEVDYDLYYQLAPLTECRRIPEALHTFRDHADRSSVDRLKTTYFHAACLAKHGHGIVWAWKRMERWHPDNKEEWTTAILKGYDFGKTLRA